MWSEIERRSIGTFSDKNDFISLPLIPFLRPCPPSTRATTTTVVPKRNHLLFHTNSTETFHNLKKAPSRLTTQRDSFLEHHTTQSSPRHHTTPHQKTFHITQHQTAPPPQNTRSHPTPPVGGQAPRRRPSPPGARSTPEPWRRARQRRTRPSASGYTPACAG